MSITKDYLEARKDYEYLCRHHGDSPDDITGGWLADEKLFDLLKNPCKKQAWHIYSSLILRSYEFGFEGGIVPDMDDSETVAIYERHYCKDLSGLGLYTG